MLTFSDTEEKAVEKAIAALADMIPREAVQLPHSPALTFPGLEIRLHQRRVLKNGIDVSPVNDELLSAVGKLTAEYGKIGGNLNQIARCLNEYGAPYNALSQEVRAALSELAALKFEVLQKVGEAVGNIQTYQL